MASKLFAKAMNVVCSIALVVVAITGWACQFVVPNFGETRFYKFVDKHMTAFTNWVDDLNRSDR